MSDLKTQLKGLVDELPGVTALERKALRNTIDQTLAKIDEDSVEKCGGDELSALRTRIYWDTYDLNSGSNRTGDINYLATAAAKLLLSEAWKGFYDGTGALKHMTFREFMGKCNFDPKLAYYALQRIYPSLVKRYEDALILTKDEQLALARRSKLVKAGPERLAGRSEVPDSIATSGARRQERRLLDLAESGDLQAQDFMERIAAGTTTKSEVFAHYGWEKPESEKKARTIIRQWDPTIIEWLEAMEMKADEWLKELALTNYQAQMYQ